MSLRPLDQRTQAGLASTIVAGGPAPRRRGVLGGLVVFAIGLAFLLQALSVPAASAFLFIALGGAFASAYVVGRRQYVYVVPGALLLGLGVGLLIPSMFGVGRFGAPIFFGALAASLVSVTLIAPDHRWPLIPAVPLAVIAIAGVVGRVDLVPSGFQPFILPLVLMLVGAYLLVEPTDH
jgi:hypothetical protein